MRQMEFLYYVAQRVHSLAMDELLDEIVQVASEVTHGDSCFIYLLDAKNNELVLRASKNSHEQLLKKITMKLGEGITGWVAQEKKAVVIPVGAHKDPRFKVFHMLPEDRYEAFLSVPILNRVGVVGVINVQHRLSHEYRATEVNLLSAIGNLVGGAVENAQLVEETLELKEMLEIRKILERAKGILMKRRGVSEEDAYSVLQKESMNTRKSLKEIAEAVLIAEKLTH